MVESADSRVGKNRWNCKWCLYKFAEMPPFWPTDYFKASWLNNDVFIRKISEQCQPFVFFVCVSVVSSLPLSHNHVRSPVLLLWGERDAFLEQEMAEACRLYIRNHFRLNIISGASHWLQQDQPDIVNTLIWTFLKEGEGRKGHRN